MELPVTFQNEGQQIVGMLHKPKLEGGKLAPAILMCHGFTGNKVEDHRLFVHVARDLCSAGFIALRIDFRGSGDSEGNFEDMTVSGEISDAIKALDFLEAQEGVDKNRIGILGLSMGGRVAACVTASDPRVKYAVLYSAALTPLEERFRAGVDEGQNKKLLAGESIQVGKGWYLKKGFLDDIDNNVPTEVMNKIKTPILIVHGDSDESVPLDVSKAGYEIIKDLNENNELYIIKGGDHTFTERGIMLDLIRKTREWLLRNA